MENIQQRGHLLTEQINPNSQNLDQLNTVELVTLFNNEDAQTLTAISQAKLELAQAIDAASAALSKGGVYFTLEQGLADV